MFMKDYCSLEKLLVTINFVLFCVSLHAENNDKDVNTAILYIMFAIAYYVSSTSCLSGATSLKHRACFPSSPIESEFAVDSHKMDVSINSNIETYNH